MKVYSRWMWGQLMIHAAFWRTIFFSMATPHTHKYLISNISSSLLSTEIVVVAVSTIVINSLFNRYGDYIFARFKQYCVIECALYATVLPLVGAGIISPSSYFITDIIAGAVICRAIHCSANRLRKLVYDRDMRERYDNCQPIATSAACIIGGLFGMLPIPLWAAWCCVAVGVAVDDVFYWVIYNKVTK